MSDHESCTSDDADANTEPRPEATTAAGAMSRRTLTQGAAALGIGVSLAPSLARGQEASPTASPVASLVGDASLRPAAGTESQERGAGGDLRLLVWQAPSVAAPHSGSGDKDFLAGSLVMEPLLHFLPDGTIIPNLVTEVPTVENGLLAADLSTATFTLLPDVTWSDGEPFTSRDVQFTWEWITTESNASVSFGVWSTIASIETPDELTAVVTYANPSVTWFEPFTGSHIGPIYPAHVFGDDPANKNEAFLSNPIGTGPYVVETFTANDQITYVLNENYREPTKPYFSNVLMKGGGDPASAARAVLQTGDFDFAWNLQVEPEVLADLEGGGAGTFHTFPGVLVEYLSLNLSDPRTEVDGQVSQKDTPHPILSDPEVRRALNLAIQRDVIAERFYGEGQPPTANVLTGLETFTSPNTSWAYDPAQAGDILDAAGWAFDGDWRAKEGVELSLSLAAPTSSVRQKEQAVIKENWESIGVRVELIQVESSVFFSGAPDNTQNAAHKEWDVDLSANGPTSPIPPSYLSSWYGGPDGSNIAQRENDWQRDNTTRWRNDEYDALFEELLQATDVERANEILVQLNDLVIENVVAIPLVQRCDAPYAISNRMRPENMAIGPRFAISTWNIANWNTVEEG
jgi:peptide/nickel transport system substrate-binding protein